MKLTVFIHTNAQQYVGAKVAEYALKKMSPNRDKFDVKILHLEDYPFLYEREGQSHLRGGKQVIWHNWDLQSFTPLRFLPPQLMNYQGRAIVIDPDIFALTDIYELLTRDMQGKAIFCRKIFPADQSREPYYGTSVMLLDCSKLTHWQWEKQIAEMFDFQRDYQPWTRLWMEAENSIGLLEEEWNHLDTLNEQTKLLHNTRRETQPWKTGLPIDFNRPNRQSGVPKKWGLIPVPWIRRTKAFIQGTEYYPTHIYRKHPDSNQEQLFFSLLRECVVEGIFTEESLVAEMENNHIRRDTLQILQYS
ncbi:hypothetical protein C7B62_23000 [Pleurocapsa sp. CCALA 161]|uniref:hypothetical protein n=1 Tax=Pleurocapsa sp. CCALA 161 TaxID=2107688 RepID=UPI000D08383A|nr:hypothetical protein [Pleurocapsa sp. CCALA 161]PSB06374.1 hypothetical protein C7B62_23000 [Pleurocapsa sp. CCALA 161]